MKLETCPIGHAPREFGVNIEVNDHIERSNIWDWVLDSGTTIIRTFHPEKNLRRPDADVSRFEAICSEAEFEDFRRRLAQAPERAIPWEDYLFDQRVPWLGVPDEIVDRITGLQIHPICSIGYPPSSYPKPIVPDLDYARQVTPDRLDWGAVASAYEYYFAEIYRYAQRGVKYFSVRNEIEQSADKFHLPESLPDSQFEGDVNLATVGSVYGDIKHHALGVQLGLLNWFARMAIEDVRSVLEERDGAAPEVRFCGLCSALGFYFIPHVLPYADVLDFHCYSKAPDEFIRKGRIAIEAGKHAGVPAALTEFNLQGGPMRIEDFLFNMTASMDVATLFETLFKLVRADELPLELLTFYLLAGPSTHRNYKHLVYGDLNLLDWTGRDQGLAGRSQDWYPQFEELQLRHATPAYAVYKMFARTIRSSKSGEPSKILKLSPEEPLYPGAEQLHTLALAAGDRTYLLLINRHRDKGVGAHLDLTAIAKDHPFAVVRETSLKRRDECVLARPLSAGYLALGLPPQSVTQVILTESDYSAVEAFRLEEATVTPGGLREGLKLHETTRLRAVGKVAGKEVDLSALNVAWVSDSDSVRVDAAGLVQRLREGTGQVRIQASVFGGPSAEVILKA